MHLLIFQYVALGRKGLETPALEIPNEFLETHLKKISQPMCVFFFFWRNNLKVNVTKKGHRMERGSREMFPPQPSQTYIHFG